MQTSTRFTVSAELAEDLDLGSALSALSPSNASPSPATAVGGDPRGAGRSWLLPASSQTGAPQNRPALLPPNWERSAALRLDPKLYLGCEESS